MSDTSTDGTERPPLVGWMVYEVDVDRDRDNPLYVASRGPFPTEEEAERERNSQREAWESAVEEWDEGNPYDFKGWQVERVLLRDFQLDKLEREDQESFEIRRQAAGAVAESLLAGDRDV